MVGWVFAHYGSPGDARLSCVAEGARVSARNPWRAVRGSKRSLRVDPGPSGCGGKGF
jgi:hypothetical protein